MSIEKSEFGRLSDGRPVEKYTLKNSAGMSAEILTYGCRIARLFVPDRTGKLENVVIGHDGLKGYEKPGDVFGAAVGRFANRIAGAEFEIGGKRYALPKNEGNNCLHCAPYGLQDRVFRVKRSDSSDDAPSITLSYLSREGEGGFPGNATVDVTYCVTTDNALTIDYRAETDAETPLNLTNHTYFNIAGNPRRDILPVEMQINADSYTEVGPDLIPTGKLVPVEGTPYDFRKAKTIGQDIRADDPMLKACGGYDHNFVLSGPKGMKKAAELYHQASGRAMLVFTDLPGMQVYTCNGDVTGEDGLTVAAHHAVCLETQFFPDSVHHPEFPYENLKPGKPFRSTTIYKFVTR